MQDPKLRARLGQIEGRVQRLGLHVFEFWRQNGPDRLHGGFLGTLDRKGQRAEPTDKSVIQQARHLWAMSMWHENQGRAPEAKALADDLYRFLVAHFFDASSGEFHFQVSESGSVVDDRKVLYAEGFVIYGLCEYARACAVPEARDRALELFRALDARAHDDLNGGYDQLHDAPWKSAEARKETNTHIHLLEAFTTLYECTKDSQVQARLEELLMLCGERLLQPAGYVHHEFELNWSPIGAPLVSYGHDLETNWLMLEAARALGRAQDPKVVAAARRMGEHAAQAGFDAARGGYFEAGSPGDAPTQLEKVWWVQCEALLGLWKLFELSLDTVQLDRLEATLGFLEREQRDPEYGEFYWGINPDGSVGARGSHKGEAWKTSYHDLRAFVFCERWIQAYLRG